MTYYLVNNFQLGLDARNLPDNSQRGAFQRLTNGYISSGGEIVRRKAWYKVGDLPDNSFGLASDGGTSLVVFGSDANPNSSLPRAVRYMQLPWPLGANPQSMSKVLSSTLFDSRLYVIARFTDGSTWHYYDGQPQLKYYYTHPVNGDTRVFDAPITEAVFPRLQEDGIYATVTYTAATYPSDGTDTWKTTVWVPNTGQEADLVVPDQVSPVVDDIINVTDAAQRFVPDFYDQFGYAELQITGGYEKEEGRYRKSRITFSGAITLADIDTLKAMAESGETQVSWRVTDPAYFPFLSLPIRLVLRETSPQRMTNYIRERLLDTITHSTLFRDARIVEGGIYNDSFTVEVTSRVFGDGQPGPLSLIQAYSYMGITVADGDSYDTDFGQVEVAGSTLDSIRDNSGVELLYWPVEWHTSNENTAARVAEAINRQVTFPDYIAVANGANVSIRLISAQTIESETENVLASNAVNGFELVWIDDVVDDPNANRPPASYLPTLYAFTYASKVLTTGGKVLAASAVDDPTKVYPVVDSYYNAIINNGSDYVTLASDYSSSVYAQSIAQYGEDIAVLGRSTIQLWSIDPDPDESYLKSVLSNTGTVAPHSVQTYGSYDMLYLSFCGIRSLRAKQASLAPTVEDVGVPVDKYVQRHFVRGNQPVDAQSIVTPYENQYWLDIEGETYALSWFPTSKILAWSQYTPPGVIEKFVVSPVDDQVYARIGNELYLYGGYDRETYLTAEDPNTLDVLTHFMDMGNPGHLKCFSHVDVTAQGAYQVSLVYRSGDEEYEQVVGRVHNTTWNEARLPCSLPATHVAVRFQSIDDQPLTLGAVGLYFTQDTGKG